MLSLIAGSVGSSGSPAEVASFGIITDVHYADADPSGTRHYRDSLPKVKAAVAELTARKAGFLIELGDFKDTDAAIGCGSGLATPKCTNLTLAFLATIEAEMATFEGPRFHLLGNHDVDVLNQSAVLAQLHDADVATPGGPGYYSFQFPFLPHAAGNDTAGCLVRKKGSDDVWIVHSDGTRNWLSEPPAGSLDAAYSVPSMVPYPKRHAGTGAYALDAADCAAAFAQRCTGCACDSTGVPASLPAPLHTPLRFIALNGDFTEDGLAWADLDGKAVSGEVWDEAYVPTGQSNAHWLRTKRKCEWLRSHTWRYWGHVPPTPSFLTQRSPAPQ